MAVFPAILALLLACVAAQHDKLPAEKQSVGYEKCLFQLPTMNGFIPTLFDGNWYWDSSTTRYSSSITCDQTLFTYSSKTNHRGQHSDHFSIKETWWQRRYAHYIHGRLKTLDPQRRAEFHGKYGSGEINFWFIDTDYKNYTLAYICHHHAYSHANEVLAFTTDRNGLSPSQRRKLQAIITRSGFNGYLHRIGMSTC